MAKHSNVKDEGAVFVIVPHTRKVTVPSSHYVIGTVGEHLSEQITFQCPKIIDGHDITGCDKKYVTWQSVDGTIGHDELVGMEIVDDVVSFKWNVRKGLTTEKGVVSFSVHFEDTVAEEMVYKFSTTACRSCEILDAVNARIGAYEAIYVAGDKLIFADYNAVADSTLKLDTKSIIPEGTLEITANGTYDVSKYAEAEVMILNAKPSISVSRDGVVTARTPADTSTHKLTSLDDPNFNKRNIKAGIDIFGVIGECPTFEMASGVITNKDSYKLIVHCMEYMDNPSYDERTLEGDHYVDLNLVEGSLVVVKTLWGHNIKVSGGAEVIYDIKGGTEVDHYGVVKITGDDFFITIEDD